VRCHLWTDLRTVPAFLRLSRKNAGIRIPRSAPSFSISAERRIPNLFEKRHCSRIRHFARLQFSKAQRPNTSSKCPNRKNRTKRKLREIMKCLGQRQNPKKVWGFYEREGIKYTVEKVRHARKTFEFQPVLAIFRYYPILSDIIRYFPIFSKLG
jgi:hypothetical protein